LIARVNLPGPNGVGDEAHAPSKTFSYLSIYANLDGELSNFTDAKRSTIAYDTHTLAEAREDALKPTSVPRQAPHPAGQGATSS